MPTDTLTPEQRKRLRDNFFEDDMSAVRHIDTETNGESELDMVEQHLADELALQREELIKAFGGCEKCYGKGYSTYIKPGNSVSSDFPDHEPIKRTLIEKPKRDIAFCSCGRGQALKKEFELQRKELEVEIESIANPYSDEYDEARNISYGRHAAFEEAREVVLTLLNKGTHAK